MKIILTIFLFILSLPLPSQNINTLSSEQSIIFRDFSQVRPASLALFNYSLLGHTTRRDENSILRVDAPGINFSQTSSAFFCRIEDAIAKSSKVNMKFRLGSVQYVDALEGKGYFEALSNSRATNFQMSRQKE